MPSQPKIEATSQQTRFNPANDGATSTFSHYSTSSNLNTGSKHDLDLHDVNLTIEGKTILSGTRIKLSNGVKYLLYGQNGIGKSTLLKALGEKLVPGIPSAIRMSILLQQQRDIDDEETDNDDATAKEGRQDKLEQEESQCISALDLVVQSDRLRTEAIKKRDLLQQALEHTTDPHAPLHASRNLNLSKHQYELEQARLEAELRSGSRGMKARKELKSKEVELSEYLKDMKIVKEDEVLKETDEAVEMLVQVEADLEAMSADTAHIRAEALLLGLGFTKSSMNAPLHTLSSGWRMRARLASSLFVPCHLLLLDEPTSYLDFSSLLWLEEYLSISLESNTILLLVTHDRAFADKVVDETLVLRDGKIETFSGNLSAYFLERSKQKKRLNRMKEALDKQTDHMNKTIQNNLRSAKRSGDDKKLKQAASRSKRLDERMGIQVSSKGTRFKLNRDLAGYHTSRRNQIELPSDDKIPKFIIPSQPGILRFPGPLISCENLSFTYHKGGKEPILRDVNLSFHLGEHFGFLGLNGVGKSTLINCLVGDTAYNHGSIDRTTSSSSSSAGITSSPGMESKGKLEGTITRHPGAVIAYYSQEAVEHLPSEITALEYLKLNLTTEQESRSVLASLGLTGRTVSDVKLSQLSGGQRVRVALAKIIYPITPHVLVLDEITTHLDADTVQVLADQLVKYKGTLILVSHDRWFMNAVLGPKMPSDGEGDSSDESDSNEGKEGMVFWVDRGKVKKLQGGVDDFEGKIRKRTAAMARMP